jgi:hypothetical protein
VALEADGHGLEPLEQLEGGQGREGGPGVAQLDRPGPDGEGRSGKSRAKTTSWKAGSGWLNSGNRSACSAQGKVPPSTMAPPRVVPWPPDELGQGVDDHVGSVVIGLQHERGGHRVVHDEGDAGRVGHGGHGLEVDDVAGRVADGLAEDGTGLLVDEGGDRLGPVVGGEPTSMPRVGSTWAK